MAPSRASAFRAVGQNAARAPAPGLGPQATEPRSIGELEIWLVESAWPFWRDHGVDRRHGGFHEALDAVTLTCPATFRRLRVLTRQIYVFARAARHGLPGADGLVAMGLEVLLRCAKQPEGGYAWRFALDGSAIDQRRDLYDHSFVLLALASAARVTGKPDLHREARELMAWLDRHMRHPSGGYRESLSQFGEPRRQNSHMHLLEATLAAWRAFGDALFLDRADEIVALFLGRLFDHRSGTLPELFSEALRARPSLRGSQLEPGHHAEWLALLDWHRLASRAAGRHIPKRSEAASASLWRFLQRGDVHSPDGALLDAVAADGSVLAAGARLWPQTERLKAAALHLPSDPQALDRAVAALAPYLDHPVNGLWHERRTPEGAFAAEPVPASSLYHLTCGILVAGSRARSAKATG